ncbi:MAG: hypothetical protein JW846_09210 [Dehalococcoidia bacterium]|nr:hypothetical protein [Dehalococcoidia bacterium]
MPRMRGRGPTVFTLALALCALLSLVAASLSATSERACRSGVNILTPVKDALVENPVPVQRDIGVLLRKPWAFSPQDFSRTMVTAGTSHPGCLSTTCFVSPVPAHASNLFWWKHRRCMCQMLDTPPPPGQLLCTL